ncbi:MAG: GAF domain-containing protein [Nitrospinaceae bacterium]|nr:MAG: GAF domain-containing protein [Nitrospinaceae bacterium]
MAKNWVSFFVEIVVLIGGLLLLDQFFLAGDRLWAIHPHPFLLVVLLAAVQYGTNQGLLTALLASAALLVGNMPEQLMTQDIYDYLLEVTYRPILWFGSAVVFGGFRDRMFREKRDLELRLAHSQKQAEVFSAAYKSLDRERHRLETQLSGQSKTLLTWHQAAKGMERLEHDGNLSQILTVIENVMQAGKCSWYVLRNSKLKKDSHKGWSEDEAYADTFGPDSPLFQEVVGRQRVVCVTALEDEKVLANEGLLAGPLINVETGEVTGMIKIEQLAFTGLNLTSIETFKVLCEWLGTHFGAHTRMVNAKQQMIQNPDNQFYSRKYYENISTFISELSERVGFESSTIKIQTAPGVELKPETAFRVQEILRETVNLLTRKTDLIFEGEKDKFELVLVLPNTPAENAHVVADKFQRTLAECLGADIRPEAFTLSIESLGTTHESQTNRVS